MKKIMLSILLVVILCTNLTAKASSPHPVVAEGALLIDMTTGKVLYEKNKDTKFYPASTTKLMTALLVLENCKLDDIVIVGEKPPFIEGSKIYINEGEELTVEQMMYALMIESANDVASAFAEHISGSEEEFAKLMTERAKELGCTNTNFVNAHGLYDPNHYSTAHDLYLIMKEVMKNDDFRKIISTKLYVLEPTNKQPEKRYFHSNNRLMFNDDYLVEGANGAKTGYTTESGHSVVATAYRGDTKLMVVLLKDKKPGLWEDAYSLLNYGFETFKTAKEVSAGDYITSLKIANSESEIPLVAEKDLYYTSSLISPPAVGTKVEIESSHNGAISKGQIMGTIEYILGEEKIGSVNLVSAADLPATKLYSYKNNTEGDLKKVYNKWLLMSPFCFIIVSIIAVLRVKKRRKKNL